MGEAIESSRSFGTNVALVQKPVPVPLDFDNPVIFRPHQNGTSAVVHSGAMGLGPNYACFHDIKLLKETLNPNRPFPRGRLSALLPTESSPDPPDEHRKPSLKYVSPAD